MEEQTIKAKTGIDRVETAVEALNISVNEFGGVNLPYMLSIYEPDIEGMRQNVAEDMDIPFPEVEFSDELFIALLLSDPNNVIFISP